MDPYKKQHIEYFNNGEEDKEEEQFVPQPELELPVEENDLIDQFKSFILYKNNLFKVELLLMNEEDPETIQELKTIKDELIPAIEVQEEKIKQIQKNPNYNFSTERIKSDDVNKLCKAFYEQSKKWFNARILSVDPESQEAEVQFIGYQDVYKLHAIYIKPFTAPEESLFQVGTQCEAIYPGDGRYYPVVIEKISEEGYQVRFKKHNVRELISIYYLRAPKKTNAEKGERKLEEMDEFKVPENLKILPSDNEQQRQAKKKKLKAMKLQFKLAQEQKYSSESQNKWQSFKEKVSTVKPDIGQKAEAIYKTPDNPLGRSVMLNNSKWGGQKKDEGHLKRLF